MSELEDVSEWGLSYDDLFEEWELAIARRAVAQFRAKHPWLRSLDFDDLFQECLTHWYFTRSTFQKSKGVSLKTYMANVLNHKLCSLFRKQLSHMRRIEHLTESLEKPLNDRETTLADTIPAKETQSRMLLHFAIEAAIKELTPLQEGICRLLEQGYMVTEIAQVLGKPRRTVRDEIRRIREAFSRKGLTGGEE